MPTETTVVEDNRFIEVASTNPYQLTPASRIRTVVYNRFEEEPWWMAFSTLLRKNRIDLITPNHGLPGGDLIEIVYILQQFRRAFETISRSAFSNMGYLVLTHPETRKL